MTTCRACEGRTTVEVAGPDGLGAVEPCIHCRGTGLEPGIPADEPVLDADFDVDLVMRHARRCALSAVRRGLWEGYDGHVSPEEWVAMDGPSVDDELDLVRELKLVPRDAVRLWRREWRRWAIIRRRVG